MGLSNFDLFSDFEQSNLSTKNWQRQICIFIQKDLPHPRLNCCITKSISNTPTLSLRKIATRYSSARDYSQQTPIEAFSSSSIPPKKKCIIVNDVDGDGQGTTDQKHGLTYWKQRQSDKIIQVTVHNKCTSHTRFCIKRFKDAIKIKIRKDSSCA